MLYIFHVDTGTTITFDIKLALQSVADLKEAIERECGVAVTHQVLLMSGGESLESNARVCSYSAGTDTNPIYLFSMAAIESQVPPIPSLDYGSDVDLQNQVDASLAMPATYQTLVARAQLAQQCCGLARDQTYICERLVHDQHLQQQGWAAVVANLEDITQTFQSRVEVLQQNFAIYLSEREQHMELLQNFNLDLRTLEKIPILPALRAQAEGFMSPEDQQQTNTGITDSTQERSEVTDALSLLKWISAKDNQSSLEQVADQCSRGLEQFDERVMEALKNEVSCAIEAANKQEMKEIRGLGERLFSLQQLMVQMKKLVHDQSELAQGFHQNKTRVSNLNDDSVLPDLCTSHREQLLVMLQNHNQLRDIRRRCTKAKEELSVSIHRRLKWIMYVENKMMELDGKLVMYHESLRRLRRQLEILRQIHLAPQMYVSAIVEVVRRRAFSHAFLIWANNLACQLLGVHSEEIKRRREFQSKFEGHFLNTLFPGLEDTPPPFATQAPSVFDNGLPKLSLEDIESLRQQLPDLTLSVSTPDLNSITQFFFSKSLFDSGSDENKEKGSTSMGLSVPPKEQKDLPLISDRRDFESETDTEEFEKIRKASTDSNLIGYETTKQQQRQYQQNRQKQLEENLRNTREEMEHLRAVIRNMKSVATDSLLGLRRELKILKEQALVDRKSATKLLEEISEAVKLHTCALKEREQEITLDHEFELSDLKKLLKARDDQLENLKRSLVDKEQEFSEQERLLMTMRQQFENEQQAMKKLQSVYREFEKRLEKAEIDKENIIKDMNEARLLETNTLKTSFQERIRELEKKLSSVEIEHQKTIKEETEKLQLECKTQLETIRSRFKLMAASTMERSPSDSSLEKIERIDMIELVNHETILEQAKKDLEIEKEEAIRLAIEHERTSFTQDLKIANDIINKNERELDIYKQREAVLLEECRHYKSTMQRLNEAESIIRKLEMDKATLDHKISAEREKLEQRETLLRLLEVERDELKRELNDERLKMNQSNIELGETLKTIKTDKDEVRVSESKKVRLEADSSLVSFPGRLEILESDNKRLNSELRVSRGNKGSLESKVELLENEKSRLEVELVKERSKRNFAADSLSSSSMASTSDNSRDKDMNASVSIVSEVSPTSRVDAATSTERSRREASSSTHSMRDKFTKSTSNLMQQSKITFMTCNPGDIVLILWDQAHRNYIVLQDSTTFYFLNSDCITDLDLKLSSDGLPTKLHTVAEVVEKEYCSARKPENRYRVPQGTRFYRVRVKPLQRHVTSTKN